MKKSVVALAISTMLVGCLATENGTLLKSRKYPVTYHSFPESATVVCHGITKGQTPVTLLYAHDYQNAMTGDRLTLDRCKAVWMSGAEYLYPETTEINLEPIGSVIGADRPKNVPGLQQDMAFAHQQRVQASDRKAQEAALKLEKERLALEKSRQEHYLETQLNQKDPHNETLLPYSKDTFNVYYGDRKVEGASASTFEILSHGYAKDAWSAYYQGRKIKDARGSSFEVIAPNYAQDTWNVYYRNHRIEEARRSSFKVLGLGYGKDVWNVYYRDQKVEGANPTTFKVERDGYGRDIHQRYLNGKAL